MKKKVVHQNPWFKVTEETFIKPNGAECTFYVVNRGVAVFILPIDKDGSIYLIKQFRHPTQTWGWELPAGSTDGEEPIVAAKRELQEETGLVAGKWGLVGIIHLTPGVSTNITHIYIAQDLVQTDQNEQEEEGIIDCRKFTMDEIKNMVASGEIHDGPTLASIAKALLFS